MDELDGHIGDVYNPTTMGTSAPDIDTLKSKMRRTWMAGDFGVIARYVEATEEEFVTRLKLTPGTRVLDVACGTGNTAMSAARKGAKVLGVDIATNLLEQARQRAREAGLEIEFQEGDAEQLDFVDASFDVVISIFGAMFAPRPERVASELLRVCRRGGTLAMGNWTPSGFIGKMSALIAKHVPPPQGIPDPSLWGVEDIARQRFGSGAARIAFARVLGNFNFLFPPAESVRLFRQFVGPTKIAFSKLDASGQAALATELEHLWAEYNQAVNGNTFVSSEYLEIHVTRA